MDLGGTGVLVIGLMLLAGFLAHLTGAWLAVPRVTILLALGALAGPGLGLVPEAVSGWFPFVAHLALAMVGFLLGESFAGKHLRERGRHVLEISLVETAAAALAVLGVLLACGVALPVALLLAGIAPASAPAAILDTVREARARGPLSDTVLGVVAIDDAWGVILFSVLLVAAGAAAGHGVGLAQLGHGAWEVLGAVVLGGAIGLPMAWVTARTRGGEPTLVEAAGFVFLTAGLAEVLGVSYLLATMSLGAVVANRLPEDARPFHTVERVSEPFLAIFFLLAGFRLEIGSLGELGLVGGAYVLARGAGLVLGGRLGGWYSGAPPPVTSYVGWCLLPQAGVAVGLALLAEHRVPEAEGVVLPLVIATTVLFELSGPLLARWSLRRAGEIPGSGG